MTEQRKTENSSRSLVNRQENKGTRTTVRRERQGFEGDFKEKSKPKEHFFIIKNLLVVDESRNVM